MFLVATADQRFWKTNEPVLFLGEWCKLYSEKSVWEKIPHEVLPYHWDDRQKLYRDYKYLQKLYERVLQDLSESLNEIHGEKNDIRYWRIIIGAWLFYFIQIFFDRYSCIDLAIKSKKVELTLIGRYSPEAWQSKHYVEFSAWSSMDDGYNQFLYSWLIERMGGLKFEYIDCQAEHSPENSFDASVHKRSLFQKILRKPFFLYEKYFPHRFNRIVIAASYLGRKDIFRLQSALCQWPSFRLPKINMPKRNFNKKMRDQIFLSSGDNLYEELLADIIKQQIPFIFLEGYQQMKMRSLDAYPKNSDVILTANSLLVNDIFKFWSAHCVQRKKKLLSVQHGGIYGSSLCCAVEEHEIKSSDIFYTWGWKSDEFENTKLLAAARFNFVQSIKSRPNGRILLALTTMTRYSYHLYSSPVGASGMLAYLDDQFNFVKTLTPEAKKLLSVRFSQADYRWDQKNRWLDQFPNLEYDESNLAMHEQLKKSRLFIGTHNATAYFEAFVANFPTILFWNPHHWELRESAKPYFDELRKVGILHDIPQAAAQKVNEIFSDSLSWWQQPKIQKARDKFCNRFIAVSDDWLPQWKEELQQQAKIARESL